MVVDDLDIDCPTVCPYTQIIEAPCDLQLPQFATRDIFKAGKSSHLRAFG
jgi:hypothetical protein